MSCSPLRILTENVAVGATIGSVPDAVATLPNANLLSERHPEITRYLSTSVTITIDLIKSSEVGCVAIPIHNLSITGTMQVFTKLAGVSQKDSGKIFAGNFLDACDYDPCVDDCPDPTTRADADSSVVAWFDNHYADQLIIEINDNHNKFGYIDLNYLMIGKPFLFRNQFNYDNVIAYLNTNRSISSLGGSAIIRQGAGNKRKISLPLDNIDSVDRATLSAIYSHDQGAPVFLAAFPDTKDDRRAEYSIMGTLINEKATAHTRYDRWNSNLEVLELWPLRR